MALDFSKNIFMSNEEKAKVSHIIMLAKTATADEKVDEAEVALLSLVAKREGLSDKDLKSILEGKKSCSKYFIPKDEEVRTQYFKDMVTMMIVDGNINPEEVKLCVAVGKKLELPNEKVQNIISKIVAESMLSDLKNDLLNKTQQPSPKTAEKDNNEDKNIAYDKKTGVQMKIVVSHDEKAPRPPFSDVEAFAMGTLAISLVGSKIQQPEAMMLFFHEFEGYASGDVKHIIASVSSEFPKALSIYMQMGDPLKKSYAAGFFAAIIKACGATNDTKTVKGWHNCVNEVLHLGGEASKSVEDGARWYDRFEHGKK